MWEGSLWLPVANNPRPMVGSAAFLHTPTGVFLVTVDAVVVDDNGMRIDLSGVGADPGLCMSSLEYESAAD